jgi:iron complex outermembrane receptor protein
MDRRSIISWMVGLMTALGAAGIARAEEPDLSPEALLFADVPIVVSSTRTERSARDVPNAITVLTAEQIKASGATSVPELLESVPGLEVMRITPGDVNVSARGFNGASSSRVLVMVDGRSVYLDHFGAVIWEGLDVDLAEIERIEVVRGPAGAMYGANAFLGTINIVTKRIRDMKPVYVQTGIGPDTSMTTATVARTAGSSGIKGSFRYRERDHFENEAGNGLNALGKDRHDTDTRFAGFNGAYEHEFADDSELRLFAATHRLASSIYTSVGVFDYDGPVYAGKIDYSRGPWRFQAFGQRIDTDLLTIPTGLPAPPVPLTDRLQSNTVDVEVQRELFLGDHGVLFGGNARRVSTDSPAILGDRETDQLYGVFGQDEYRINDWLTAFLSLRADRHPATGIDFSPRAALMARVNETDRVRLSFARAFRLPTQTSLYDSLPLQAFIPAPTTLVVVQGNEDLDPIWVTAYELGFQKSIHPKLNGKLDLFYNVLEDFQSFVVTSPGLPTIYSFRNQGQTEAYGGELTLEWQLLDDLWGFTTYSYQSAKGPDEGVFPRHKASAGVRGHVTPQIRYALTGVMVGHADYDPSSGSSTPENFIRSHTQLDGFVGVQVLPQFELGFHARNMLHQVRRQFPRGEEIGSELMVSGTLEF